MSPSSVTTVSSRRAAPSSIPARLLISPLAQNCFGVSSTLLSTERDQSTLSSVVAPPSRLPVSCSVVSSTSPPTPQFPSVVVNASRLLVNTRPGIAWLRAFSWRSDRADPRGEQRQSPLLLPSNTTRMDLWTVFNLCSGLWGPLHFRQYTQFS